MRRTETSGTPVDHSARVEQEKFQYSTNIQLRYKVFQSDRHHLFLYHSFLVHRDHVASKDAASTPSGTASPSVAAQALLSRHPDVHAVVLHSPDVSSTARSSVHQLDRPDGAQNHHRRVVPEASAVESAADLLAVWQEGGSLVRRGGHRARPEDLKCIRRDGNGSSVGGHCGRPKRIF